MKKEKFVTKKDLKNTMDKDKKDDIKMIKAAIKKRKDGKKK